MSKRLFVFCFLFVSLLYFNLFAQYNIKNTSAVVPWVSEQEFNKMLMPNPNTVGFAYYPTAVRYSQLFKFNITQPYNTTLIGSPKLHLMTNGDFANPTGVWKFYVQQDTLPYTIFEVDTSNGNLTNVGAPVNLKSGHHPVDMEWDHTSNTMYFISSNDLMSETQFYSMYWPTKELTWIGSSVTSPTAIIAGGFNANGTYFGIDIASDALWKVNKFTGAWTQVGILGYPVSFQQDAGFDRSDFSKMYWAACGGTVGLYQIDTATGSASLINSFPGYNEVFGIGFTTYPGPQIQHNPLLNTQNVIGPYAVNAVVLPSGSGIASAKLYWSRNNPAITDSVSLINSGGNNWTGNIPGNGLTSVYRYYLVAKDSLNRTSFAPYNAPLNLYSFIAIANDTVKPVITHTPLGNITKVLWPDSISAYVKDNYGIDSAWVRWKINSGVSKQFKLQNSSDSTFTSVFNSVNSDISIGDTVYYRIIAQDNSPNHNKDSTNLISFIVIKTSYTCIGNGNVTVSYASPFNTFWKGFKTQMLWTAQEIISNGGTAGNLEQIGFNVITLNNQAMDGFNIKMQNTPLTSLSNGFITSDWTTVFNNRFVVPGLGWQYITLQTPFYWDGTSSLLIEICFGNSTSSSGTYVLGTTIPGMEYYGHRDDSLACSVYPNSSGSAARPNICFRFNDPLGIINSNSIPSEYKLSQNYPNPFNPVTKISFDIPVSGNVNLKVFDVLGRVVKELVNEFKSKGSYSIDFNASGLSSGIYLYRLESNDFVDTKRMILLK